MAQVCYRGASRIYAGTEVPAVDQLDLAVQDGEFMVLVGPSGSGKSTALRMLAGLEPVDAGAIEIDGVDVSRTPPMDRDIAMVFQSYALYPHMTVAENMGFALKMTGVGRAERDAKVRDAARVLDLEPYLGRKPKALSGGQRQRVAMGRAIVRNPKVFLMDEPLSNLDAKLRVETRANIASLQARLGTTTLFVTHDQVEAMTMGDRVAVLKEGGLLQQVDTPRNLYDRPENAFVAGFIGSPAMNLRTVPVIGTSALLGDLAISLAPEVAQVVRQNGLNEITLGIRPESFHAATSDGALKVSVSLVEELGADSFVYGHVAGDDLDEKHLVIRYDGRLSPRIGDAIEVLVRAEEIHAFHPVTGARL